MLSEKIILVSGVGGAIGNSIVKHLVPISNSVVSSSRSKVSTLYEYDAIPLNYTHIPLDLTEEKNIVKLFQMINQKFGRLDVFINTIGGSLYSHRIEDYPLEEFEEILKVNLISAFLLTKHAIRLMRDNIPLGGNIIHIISSSSRKISHNKAPYGIAKAGLAKLVNYVASEVGEYDIRVNGISPGYIFTPRHLQDIETETRKTGKSEHEIIRSKLKLQKIQRKMYPEDLLPLVELLSTTKVITGQNYNCTVGEVLNY
ncbi:MAG: SDR family oxidoreductase [Candidatus Lokiarchaeota archaeon]|nr:SDR family oxidoreductase [Candidatus Lokiarchaeota archaeon]